jgi:hypothetical protein
MVVCGTCIKLPPAAAGKRRNGRNLIYPNRTDPTLGNQPLGGGGRESRLCVEKTTLLAGDDKDANTHPSPSGCLHQA